MPGAMILAAGRGERMRPLSDTVPKPLLKVAGEPLIVHQLRALARAGFSTIAINVSHLGDKLVDAIGDGSRYGVAVRWSREPEPLETAGGIATAMPLLPEGPALIVSGDIWTRYDYARLLPIARRIAGGSDRRVHLVMVPNPPYHPAGDFSLDASAAARDSNTSLHLHAIEPTADGRRNYTYGNIGLYDTALFRELPRGVKLKLLPHLVDWIAGGRVSGELYEGPWENVGTPDDLARLDAKLARGGAAGEPA